MSTKESCKTCQLCLACQGSAGYWCRLREIKVHSDIAPFAFCHHWTKREPTLPNLEARTNEVFKERQLELSRTLTTIETKV